MASGAEDLILDVVGPSAPQQVKDLTDALVRLNVVFDEINVKAKSGIGGDAKNLIGLADRAAQYSNSLNSIAQAQQQVTTSAAPLKAAIGQLEGILGKNVEGWVQGKITMAEAAAEMTRLKNKLDELATWGVKAGKEVDNLNQRMNAAGLVYKTAEVNVKNYNKAIVETIDVNKQAQAAEKDHTRTLLEENKQRLAAEQQRLKIGQAQAKENVATKKAADREYTMWWAAQLKEQEALAAQHHKTQVILDKASAREGIAIQKEVDRQVKLSKAQRLALELAERDELLAIQKAVTVAEKAQLAERIAAEKAASVRQAALMSEGASAGKAASRQQAAGAGLRNAFGTIRQLAYILPGIGIAGIFNLLFEGIEKTAKAFYNWSTNAEEAAKKTERLKKETEELAGLQTSLAKSEGESAGALDVLYTRSQDQTLSLKDRIAATNELQELYPAYFKNLSDEAILAGEAANVYLQLRDALVAKAAVQVYQDKYNDALSKEISLQEKLEEKKKARNKLDAGSVTTDPNTGKVTGFDMGNAKDVYEAVQLGEEIKELESEITEVSRKRLGYLDKIEERSKSELKLKKDTTKEDKRAADAAERERKRKEAAQKKEDDAKFAAKRQLADANKDATKDELKDIKQAEQDKYEAILHGLKLTQEAYQESYAKEKEALDKRELSQKRYNQELNKLNTKYAKEILQDQITNLKELVPLLDPTSEGYAKLNEVLIKLVEQYNKLKDVKPTNLLGISPEDLAAIEKLASQAIKLAQSLADFNAQLQQAKIKQIDEEIDKINERRDTELAALRATTEYQALSEQDRAQAEYDLRVRQDARIDDLEEKKKERLRKTARLQKAVAITQIITETALAVVRALGDSSIPGPARYALAVATGLTGAAQLATAIAAPLPEYRMGTKDHPGGLAIVGDGGVQEYVRTPSGETYVTPNVPTVADIPAHSVVFKNASEFIKDAHGITLGGMGVMRAIDERNGYSLEQAMDRQTSAIVTAVKNTPRTNVSITASGITHLVKIGGNNIKFIHGVRYD